MTSNSSKKAVESPRGIWEWVLSLLRRLFGSPFSDDEFVNGLIEEAVRKLSEVLEIAKEDLARAFEESREGKANELARRLGLRVDCSLKKISASRVSVTLSILTLSEGESILTKIQHEASWDELPREVRAEFIRHNPGEVHYVICDQPEVRSTEKVRGT
ncbi:MAG TPA: hypothetical protein VIW67_13340 [Terriglobales bacterium]|jgi:hypothetical protein